MKRETLYAGRRSAETIADGVNKVVGDGNEVIVVIGEKNINPGRIVKIIKATVGDYDVKLIVRHAELREYLENVFAGAAIGGGIGVIGTVLTLLRLGSPIGWAQILAGAGIGALAGGIIGAAVTPVASVQVYKYKGETRLKFSPAPDAA